MRVDKCIIWRRLALPPFPSSSFLVLLLVVVCCATFTRSLTCPSSSSPGRSVVVAAAAPARYTLRRGRQLGQVKAVVMKVERQVLLP